MKSFTPALVLVISIPWRWFVIQWTQLFHRATHLSATKSSGPFIRPILICLRYWYTTWLIKWDIDLFGFWEIIVVDFVSEIFQWKYFNYLWEWVKLKLGGNRNQFPYVIISNESNIPFSYVSNHLLIYIPKYVLLSYVLFLRFFYIGVRLFSAMIFAEIHIISNIREIHLN